MNPAQALHKNLQAVTVSSIQPHPWVPKGTQSHPCSREQTHSRDIAKKGGVSGSRSPVGRDPPLSVIRTDSLKNLVCRRNNSNYSEKQPRPVCRTEKNIKHHYGDAKVDAMF